MWFYNKYRCTNIIDLISKDKSDINTIINNKICYLAYFKVGEKGLFLYRPGAE